VLFFSTRLLRADLIELPVTADLRLATKEATPNERVQPMRQIPARG